MLNKIFKLIVTAVIVITGMIQAASDKPNLVVVYVDDLGYGDVGCYGATDVQTPSIDKLAAEGMLFTDGHASSATCTPSRYSLLTGSHAFRGKARILPGDAPLLIRPGTPTLQGMLQKNGYKTAVIGKWHLGLGDGDVNWNGKISPGPLEIGFDYSYLIPATGDRVPCVMVENHHVVGLDPEDPIEVNYYKKIGTDKNGLENPDLMRYPADEQHAKTIVNGVSRIGYMSGGNSARWKDETIPYQMLHKARTFIDQNKESPFFIYFSFHDIHVPCMPDHRFQGATKLGPRGDAIVQMDYITGKLMEHLEKCGLKENTMVIFSSDNGPVVSDGYSDTSYEKLGSHKPGGKFRGGKYSALEAGTRVPTIISWPAQIKPGRSDALINQLDIYSSVASIIGHELENGEAPDSFDMLDVILGKSTNGRELMLREAYSSFSLRKNNYKYIPPVEEINEWIQTVKKIEGGESLEAQLYDLSNDIGEQNNIAKQHPELVAELEADLQKIIAKPTRR
jgi:arylsulfatase A-like enzyme